MFRHYSCIEQESAARLTAWASGTLSLARNCTLCFLLFSLTPSGFTQDKPSQESLIQVEITGLRNDKGKVLCSLYSSPDGFPKQPEKAVAHATSEIAEHHAFCRFSGISQGTYAVSAIHDENSNGRLDTNFMGIPREGVGASNNARGHFGPPKFDAAAFHFAGGRRELKITIMYL
jgi:uncharacterized protein (DUF2141 family)